TPVAHSQLQRRAELRRTLGDSGRHAGARHEGPGRRTPDGPAVLVGRAVRPALTWAPGPGILVMPGPGYTDRILADAAREQRSGEDTPRDTWTPHEKWARMSPMRAHVT